MTQTLLPPNSTELEIATEAAMAKAFDHPIVIDQLWSADDCPIELLPFLAWALSVDAWNPDWPENVKRQVVASSAYVHRFKGTRAGMNAALNALDLGVTISEWFEHGGQPYTFRLDAIVTARGVNAYELKSIFDSIANTKNARSHLERLKLHLVPPVIFSAGLSCRIGISITVPPGGLDNGAQQ